MIEHRTSSVDQAADWVLDSVERTVPAKRDKEPGNDHGGVHLVERNRVHF